MEVTFLELTLPWEPPARRSTLVAEVEQACLDAAPSARLLRWAIVTCDREAGTLHVEAVATLGTWEGSS